MTYSQLYPLPIHKVLVIPKYIPLLPESYPHWCTTQMPIMNTTKNTGAFAGWIFGIEGQGLGLDK